MAPLLDEPVVCSIGSGEPPAGTQSVALTVLPELSLTEPTTAKADFPSIVLVAP